MPVWLGWVAIAYVGSKAIENLSQAAENTAEAGTKAGAAALLVAGAYFAYKKVSG